MKKSVITLFVWLLFAALPLQGFAVATNMCCGQTQDRTVNAKAETEHYHHDGLALDSHEKNIGQYAHMTNVQHGDNHVDKHSTCETCTGCCGIVAAMPGNSIVLPLFPELSTVLLDPAPLVTGFIPSGLERPPRYFSV